MLFLCVVLTIAYSDDCSATTKKLTMFMDKGQPLQYLIHNISDDRFREQFVSGRKMNNLLTDQK